MELPEDIEEKILSISLSNNPIAMDTPIWSLDPNGTFSTHSVYNLLHQHQQTHIDYQWIWKLRTLNKIKLFLWQCYRDRLPTKSYLHKIGVTNDYLCPICKNRDGTITHIFLHNVVAQTFWDSLGIDTHTLPNDVH